MIVKSTTYSICVALLLCVWAGVSHGRTVALLVGVGDYQDKRLDILGVDRDLDRAEQMMRRFGVAKSDISRLYNRQATVAAVERRLGQYATDLRQQDVLYLYISTHGLQLADTDGDEADGRDEALALSDFAVGEPGDEHEVRGVLRDDRLAELLAALPNERTVVIADTCHSGSISKTFGDDFDDVLRRVGKFIQMPRWLSGRSGPEMGEALEELSQPRVVLLSAAADGELADIDENGSVFTRALADTQIDPEQDNAWCWFRRARSSVRASTGGVQWPQFNSEFAAGIRPLSGDAGAMHGMRMLQRCSASEGFSAQLQGGRTRSRLVAISQLPGWVSAVSVHARHNDMQLQPQASRWHHGASRSVSLGRSGRTASADAGAWVLWTADGVERPRHKGDFSVLWKALQRLPDDQWASAFVQGVDLDGH